MVKSSQSQATNAYRRMVVNFWTKQASSSEIIDDPKDDDISKNISYQPSNDEPLREIAEYVQDAV